MKNAFIIISLFLGSIVASPQARILITDKYDRSMVQLAYLKTPTTAQIEKNYPGYIIHEAAGIVIKMLFPVKLSFFWT